MNADEMKDVIALRSLEREIFAIATMPIGIEMKDSTGKILLTHFMNNNYTCYHLLHVCYKLKSCTIML